MANFTPHDIIFATIVQNGFTRAAARLTGVSSIADILGQLRAMVPGLCGMTTLNVRNATDGWTASRAVLLK